MYIIIPDEKVVFKKNMCKYIIYTNKQSLSYIVIECRMVTLTDFCTNY